MCVNWKRGHTFFEKRVVYSYTQKPAIGTFFVFRWKLSLIVRRLYAFEKLEETFFECKYDITLLVNDWFFFCRWVCVPSASFCIFIAIMMVFFIMFVPLLLFFRQYALKSIKFTTATGYQWFLLNDFWMPALLLLLLFLLMMAWL